MEEDNKTLWCGNLPEQATEELLYELFLQAGPLEKVRIPRDREGRQKNFAFISFCHDVSVPYAMNLFRGSSLFHRTLSLQCRARMALLPPPIRCNSLDQSFNFNGQGNVKQQFAEMTNNLRGEDYRLLQAGRLQQQFDGGDLVMASLQGNWSHRHHPYRGKDQQRHGNYQGHDDGGHGLPHNRDNRHTRGERDRREHSGAGRYNDRRKNHHRRN